MKIIRTDNYDRELFDDIVITNNIVNKYYGEEIVDLLNNNPKRCDEHYFKLVEDDYQLFERDY